MKVRKLVMLFVVVAMLLALPLSASAIDAGTIQGQGNLVVSGNFGGAGNPQLWINVYSVVNGVETLVGQAVQSGQMNVYTEFTFTFYNLPQGTYKIDYYAGPNAGANFTTIAFY
ncbi:hypothetical protein I6N90_01435 [Paenibacillus sp. GSMTC-2017]|uniref:hypothetical protein n=1 Tax=Paenibacillus sp. GSMTC-2017 TaxID=2794350 RepID=UPI0018D68429|nr:hypothetical protein [Paenibacillus sp. GSMTC-2017]MBH5316466.1 hypothetical protein [Paenibacillus sp. GSMTC-2017]